MRRRRRSRSLQTRVLALVGAGVFLAGALLSLLSRSSLQSLERELSHDHQRLAASVARDLSRAVSNDMRLLARAAVDTPQGVGTALHSVREFGRLTTAAFVVTADGRLGGCEPVHECTVLPAGAVVLATEAAATQRPRVSAPLRTLDGRRRLVGVMPLRQAANQPVAAGLLIDVEDVRLQELLTLADIAPTLHARLDDSTGVVAGRAPVPDGATLMATAAVPGTPWTLALLDTGPDPRAPIALFRRQSLWLAPSLAVLATLLAWGIAQSVRQPLIGLTAAAERIARGNLEKPIDDALTRSGGSEIDRLAGALERMRCELQTSIGEIESANEELEWRVGERTRDLAAANRHLEERERLRQKLLRQVISAQEEERKRVARELHDETSQTLAALGMSVDLGRLDEVRRFLDRLHHDIHRMIVNLRPSVLDDLGLAAAIRWYADRHLAKAGIAVRCEVGELEERLPPEIETATFRIVQEALSNIARHSGAETVLVRGTVEHGQLAVEIEDDGRGFDLSAIVTGPDTLRGVDLLGMRERVDILGGSLTIESTPGAGTRVAFSLPVPVSEPSGATA